MPPDPGTHPEADTPPTPEDRKRIEHMLRCSHDARLIVAGDDAPVIASDMVRTRALVNCFTEIGEAAARLTPPARAHVGAVPWRQIVGMRNIVVHVYWGIDLGELVKTARDDLPPLERNGVRRRRRKPRGGLAVFGPAGEVPTESGEPQFSKSSIEYALFHNHDRVFLVEASGLSPSEEGRPYAFMEKGSEFRTSGPSGLPTYLFLILTSPSRSPSSCSPVPC
jgi:uncharacterized protein with HEPN domain